MEQEKAEALGIDAISEGGLEHNSAPASEGQSKKKRERGPQIAFDLSMAFAPVALLAVLVSLSGLLSGVVSGGTPGWIFELCASFRTQCIIILMMATIPFVLSKPWRMFSVVTGLIALVNIALVSPYLDFNKVNEAKSSYLSFSLLEMIVDSPSVTVEEAADIAAREATDIVVLLDIDLAKMPKLNDKIRGYHNRALFPSDKGKGICVYADVPLKGSQVVVLGKDRTPVVVTTAFFEYGWTNIVAFRAPYPDTAESFEKRNNLFQAVSKMVSGLKGPTIVCGNFNVAPYVGSYGKLLGDAKLKAMRDSFSMKPNSFAGPQDLIINRLPLDYILVNDKVGYISRAVVTGYDGQHMPLKGTFSLANKDEKYVAPKLVSEPAPQVAPSSATKSETEAAATQEKKTKETKVKEKASKKKSRKRHR